MLCKKLATLICKRCGYRLCYKHAVMPCCYTTDIVLGSLVEVENMHELDGIDATYCRDGGDADSA